jgi:ubiquinone/menaquinone biosynthesis C-methylase UbiE
MPEQTDYRRLYDRLAPFYAPAMRLFPMWRGYTEAVLPWLPTDGAVLEIGPGPGVLLRKLAARHPFAAGFDLSRGMLRRARQRLRRAGLPDRLVRGDLIRLPFAAASLDGLALTFTFSAVPDGDAAMREMARVLRPGGVIALVDACEPENGNRVALWLARQWERFGDHMRDESALMRTAGLEIVEQREFGAFSSIRLTVGRKPDGPLAS